MNMTKMRKILLYIICFLAAAGIAYFLYRYSSRIMVILKPIFMAMVIAYILHPLVERLEKKKIKRSTSILMIYLGLLILVSTSIIFIIPELINSTKDLMDTLPDITARYQDMINKVVETIDSIHVSPEIKEVVYREVGNGVNHIEKYITGILRKSLTMLLSIITLLLDFLLSLVIAYYLVKDREFFREAALSLLPRKSRSWFVSLGREINTILSNFIQGQLLVAVIIGLLEIIGLLMVKVKYAMILGIVGGLANVIPYFGPFIGAVPAVAVALTDSPAKALWTVLVFIIVQQIDNNFVSPKIIEGKLGLHPISTIIAVLVGGEFYGILGMLLAVPIAAILKVIIKRVVDILAG